MVVRAFHDVLARASNSAFEQTLHPLGHGFSFSISQEAVPVGGVMELRF
jgi:hypothetical protein